MTTPNVFIENISLAYGNEIIFRNLNLKLSANKWIALLGQSGVGKSSLLRLLAGLTDEKETISGQIYADNDISVSSQIAYMAQTDLLLPWLNVLDNATLGLKLNDCGREFKTQIITKAKSLLHDVGLSHAVNLFPHQLSGGMRQRVALVRTLLAEKPIVLMDEPFSALDAITRYKLQELAAVILKNKTVLFITHDPTEALRLADEIYILRKDGFNRIAALTSDTPRDLADPDLIKLQPQLFNKLIEGNCVL